MVRTLIALAPTGMLLAGSYVRLSSGKSLASLLQFVGAGCLVLVVLTHIFEALKWVPSMGWGLERSLGHYVDLAGAGLGVTLFPLGYLLGGFERRA